MFNFQLKKKVDYLLDSRLKIAVTGLSRSGKTAFITSLVNALINIDDLDEEHLKFFSSKAKGHILGVEIIEQNDLGLARFAYEKNILGLKKSPPQWPSPTEDLTTISLAIKYRTNKNLLDKISSGSIFNSGTLYLDIFDYPGEWLLDLAMLDKDLAQWSYEMQKLCHQGERKNLIQPVIDAIKSIDLKGKKDLEALAKVADTYKNFLFKCKELGLEYIQPGRFVLPGENQDSPALSFFPLLSPEKYSYEELKELIKFATKNEDSNIGIILKRYNYYIKQFVEKFYSKYFKNFDRQVILADCLTPLNNSREAFFETKKSIEEIFNHFNYGNRNLFSRLFFPKIDKLAFIATKEDHVTRDQRDNLKSLLKTLVSDVYRKTRFNEVNTEFFTLASIRSTKNVLVQRQGEDPIVALRGILKNGTEYKIIYPGDVPSYIPSEQFWKTEGPFNFSNFSPLPLDNKGRILNLNLDEVLEFLLADKIS